MFLNAINLKDFCRVSKRLKSEVCNLRTTRNTKQNCKINYCYEKVFPKHSPVCYWSNKQTAPPQTHAIGSVSDAQTNNESTTESKCLDFSGKSTYECFTCCLCIVNWDWRNYFNSLLTKYFTQSWFYSNLCARFREVS